MSDSLLANVLRSLAANIRRQRIRRGFSQEALAEIVNVSGRYVQRIEQGVAEPSLRTVVELSRALDTPIGTLFRPIKSPLRRVGRPTKRG